MELELTIKGQDLGLDEIHQRLTDFKPVFRRAVSGLLNNPQSYTRPDRFRGGRGRAGEIRSWAPGYQGTMRHRLRKRSIVVDSTRPYAPVLTSSAERELAELFTRFVLEHESEGVA